MRRSRRDRPTVPVSAEASRVGDPAHREEVESFVLNRKLPLGKCGSEGHVPSQGQHPEAGDETGKIARHGRHLALHRRESRAERGIVRCDRSHLRAERGHAAREPCDGGLCGVHLAGERLRILAGLGLERKGHREQLGARGFLDAVHHQSEVMLGPRENVADPVTLQRGVSGTDRTARRGDLLVVDDGQALGSRVVGHAELVRVARPRRLRPEVASIGQRERASLWGAGDGRAEDLLLAIGGGEQLRGLHRRAARRPELEAIKPALHRDCPDRLGVEHIATRGSIIDLHREGAVARDGSALRIGQAPLVVDGCGHRRRQHGRKEHGGQRNEEKFCFHGLGVMRSSTFKK